MSHELPPIKIYSLPDCMHCAKVKKYLNEHDIAFENFDLSTNVEGQKFMDEHGYHVVPVVVIGNDTFFGSNLQEIAGSLEAQGYLE